MSELSFDPRGHHTAQLGKSEAKGRMGYASAMQATEDKQAAYNRAVLQRNAALKSGVNEHEIPRIAPGMASGDLAQASQRIQDIHMRRDPRGATSFYAPPNTGNATGATSAQAKNDMNSRGGAVAPPPNPLQPVGRVLSKAQGEAILGEETAGGDVSGVAGKNQTMQTRYGTVSSRIPGTNEPQTPLIQTANGIARATPDAAARINAPMMREGGFGTAFNDMGRNKGTPASPLATRPQMPIAGPVAPVTPASLPSFPVAVPTPTQPAVASATAQPPSIAQAGPTPYDYSGLSTVIGGIKKAAGSVMQSAANYVGRQMYGTPAPATPATPNQIAPSTPATPKPAQPSLGIKPIIASAQPSASGVSNVPLSQNSTAPMATRTPPALPNPLEDEEQKRKRLALAGAMQG